MTGRLIDADGVLGRHENDPNKPEICDGMETHQWLLQCLREAPTIDPVHAAGGCYCRECVMGSRAENGKVHCQLKLIVNGPDDFCSSGKIRLEVLEGKGDKT